MKKTAKIVLFSVVILSLCVFLFSACNKNSITKENVIGRYDITNFPEGYEYQYIELDADGNWNFVYKEVKKSETRVSGTYTIEKGAITFSGNDIAEKISLDIVEDKPVISYNNVTFSGMKESSFSLNAPVITIEGSIVSWQAVDGAIGYLICEGGNVFASKSALSYDISEQLVKGVDYEITVIACNGNVLSVSSNMLNVKMSPPQLPAVTGLHADTSGYHLTWNKVNYAIGYIVYDNGNFCYSEKASDTQIYFYPYYSINGSHTFSVVAVGDNEEYSDSIPATLSVTVTEGENVSYLPAPSLTLNGSKLEWNSIAGAESYDLYLDKFLYKTDVESGINPDMLIQDYYNLSVRAICEYSEHCSSSLSNEVRYYQETTTDHMQSPQITPYGDQIYWDQISGADENKIMEGDTLLATTETNDFVLTDLNFEVGSTHNITVITVSAVSGIQDSLPSNIAEYTYELTKLYQPNNLTLGATGYIFCDIDCDCTTHYKVFNGETLLYTGEIDEHLFGVYNVGCYFDESQLQAGTYQLHIVAHDDTQLFADSLPSNTIQYIKY